MHIYCALSCDTCPERYEMTQEEEQLLIDVQQYGEPQRVEGNEYANTFQVIRKTIEYMQNVVFAEDSTINLSPEIIGECVNRESLCAFWAAIGECQANPGYMKLKCAPSCQTCDMIDINNRCPPLSDDAEPGLLPGGLNAMFERIVATAPGNNTHIEIAQGMTNYSVIVHSRPAPVEGEAVISKEVDLKQPPWLITFNNFLTDEECETMISLGHKSVYERSKDVGALQADGSYDSVESNGRTSENAWCSYQKKCRDQDVPKRIHERIELVTGIKANYSEDFQILKYEPGQFYRKHHDYIELQADRQCGPRILTFFLYLNDVEEGGATNFPLLDIAVKPKKGQAVLWPSVLNSDPKAKDYRTDHEAQDVVQGIKFGANAWLHLYDYMAASEMGCT
ncbi:hypothetical protein ACHAWX_004862 [Stephanocyclus meneghinianus]